MRCLGMGLLSMAALLVSSPATAQSRPDSGERLKEPVWSVDQDPFDPRLRSGVASVITGSLALGLGTGGFLDNEGFEEEGALARAGLIGGGTSLGLGAMFLSFAAIEGSDSPRVSEGMTATGQAMTAIGFAATAGFQGAMVHDYFDDRGIAGVTLLPMFPSAGLYVTGMGLWFGGARDPDDLWVRRPYRRSPTMATVGGLAVAKGLMQMGTGLFVAISEESKRDQEVMAISLAVGTITDLSVGTSLLIFGLTETQVELPDEVLVPEVAAGPGNVTLTWQW